MTRAPGTGFLKLIACALSATACGQLHGTPIEEEPLPAPDSGVILCTSDNDCAGLGVCFNGLCVEAICTDKQQCADGLVCLDGNCVEPPQQCSSPEHCPGTLVCEGFSHQCIDPYATTTGCVVDADCDDEVGCEEGCICAPTGECELAQITEPVTNPRALSIDLSGYRIENREDSPPQHIAVLPDGTVLEAGDILIIARNSSASAFAAAWHISLDATIHFFNAEAENSGVPIINGGERWALVSPSGVDVDGPTITGRKNRSYQRINSSSAAAESSWMNESDSFTGLPSNNATPGTVSLPSTGIGLVISEWSDADSYIYEFIEIYYAP